MTAAKNDSASLAENHPKPDPKGRQGTLRDVKGTLGVNAERPMGARPEAAPSPPPSVPPALARACQWVLDLSPSDRPWLSPNPLNLYGLGPWMPPNPVNLYGLGPDVTKTYEFIWFGAMDVAMRML